MAVSLADVLKGCLKHGLEVCWELRLRPAQVLCEVWKGSGSKLNLQTHRDRFIVKQYFVVDSDIVRPQGVTKRSMRLEGQMSLFTHG